MNSSFPLTDDLLFSCMIHTHDILSTLILSGDGYAKRHHIGIIRVHSTSDQRLWCQYDVVLMLIVVLNRILNQPKNIILIKSNWIKLRSLLNLQQGSMLTLLFYVFFLQVEDDEHCRGNEQPLHVLPLYSLLSSDKQAKVFQTWNLFAHSWNSAELFSF